MYGARSACVARMHDAHGNDGMHRVMHALTYMACMGQVERCASVYACMANCMLAMLIDAALLTSLDCFDTVAA